MKINKAIQEFVDSAIASGYVSKEDRYYLLNRVLYLVGEESFESSKEVEQPSLLDAMANLVEAAVESGKIENDSEERDWLEQELMNLMIPKPSELNRLFWDKYEEGPKVATDAFYKIALDLNLIKVKDIAKNISFNGETEYGDLEITINLSKPEKTKEEIIKAAQSKEFQLILPTVFALKTWATMVVSTGQVALTTVLSEWNLAESLGGITILHMLIILSYANLLV